MKVEVVTPEEYHRRDIIGDLNSRRGQVDMAPRRVVTRGWSPQMVPLANMFGYVNEPALHEPGPRSQYTMHV
jgi:translation elongation factor EF-G